jgi:predicted CXXCH cytochrome family protein
MKLGVFAQTSNSRCPSKSRHGRVSTDCNGIAGMIGIGAQNLGSRQMGAALSHLRHCFVRLRTFAITLVLLLSAYPSRADIHQHPVLLPANVDPSKCLECHKDKSSGKYVHTAVSMGCTVCHTVANVKASTYVSLSSPADQLCVTCHKLSTDPVQHPPYKEGNCGFCHSPHASNFPAHLYASPQDICMACHVRGLMKVNRKAHTVTLSWGTTIPFKEMDSWFYLDLDKTHKLNHPVEGHPISAPMLPLARTPLPSLVSLATSPTTPPIPTLSCQNTKTPRLFACPATYFPVDF